MDESPAGNARPTPAKDRRREVVSWALYDWGNSAFATSVMVVFFPLAFNEFWSTEASAVDTTSRLMAANGLASLILALSMPALGAIADQSGARKAFLMGFAGVGILATAAMYWAPSGAWLLAATAFVVASIGFAAGNVFYDAMLIGVAGRDRLDRVSALGFALGYLGGGVLLAVHALMATRPEWLGLPDAEAATRVVFLTVAVWWALFALPLALFVSGATGRERRPVRTSLTSGIRQLIHTFHSVRSLRPVWLFLLAYWLYIDGVNTLTKAAVDYAYKLDFARGDLVLAILLVQFVSFPSALVCGRLAGVIGVRRTLLACLAIYIAATCWAGLMTRVWELYLLAGAIGVGQGGVYSLSRSFYARLIPDDQAAEFFGFYNTIGKLAAVIGPFLVIVGAQATGSPRAAVVAILPLLLLGAALLMRTPAETTDGAA